MRTSLSTNLLTAGLLLVGLAAVPALAQQIGVLDHVQRDLDRAASNPYLKNRERGRIDHARHEIWEFQRKWASGRFDKGRLDDSIGAVRGVVNASSIDYRDRQALQDDLNRMRQLRFDRGYTGYR